MLFKIKTNIFCCHIRRELRFGTAQNYNLAQIPPVYTQKWLKLIASLSANDLDVHPMKLEMPVKLG